MKIKTKLIQCTDGSYRIKTTVANGRRKFIRYFSGNELGVSSGEIPCVDFRSKILEILREENERRI